MDLAEIAQWAFLILLYIKLLRIEVKENDDGPSREDTERVP